MVLDHLVVQQMGKENEEGDIDNMLLHGARQLYDPDEEDIVYTSKNVDDLIDRVEQEADAEAKALEDREKRKAAGEEMEANPLETMSFGFAKIWEAEKTGLSEVEVTEDAGEDQTEAWNAMMESMRRAREEAAREEEGKRAKRSRNEVIQYQIDHDADLTSSKKKAKRDHLKAQGDDSDAEFEALIDPSDIEDYDSEGSEPEVMEAVPPTPMSKKAINAARKHTAHQALAALAAGGGSTHTVYGNGQAPGVPSILTIDVANGIATTDIGTGPPNLVAEPVPPAPKPQGLSKKDKLESQLALMRIRPRSRIPSGRPLRITDSDPMRGNQALHLAFLIRGRAVLQSLYQTLRSFGLFDGLEDWATMAQPDLPTSDRQFYYALLARIADDRLKAMDQRIHYEKKQIALAAAYVLTHRESVVPAKDEILVPLPNGTLVHATTHNVVRTNVEAASGTSSQPKLRPFPVLPELGDGASLVVPVSNEHAKKPIDISNGRSRLEIPCPVCDGLHTIAKCPVVPSVKILVQQYHQVVASDQSPADKASLPNHVSRCHADVYRRRLQMR